MTFCNHVFAEKHGGYCVKCDFHPDPEINAKRRPARYSGPNKSGICVCGHPWHEHHRGIVVRLGSILTADGVREGYVLGECEHYGFNESGGLGPDGEPHCFGYKDSKDES